MNKLVAVTVACILAFSASSDAFWFGYGAYPYGLAGYYGYGLGYGALGYGLPLGLGYGGLGLAYRPWLKRAASDSKTNAQVEVVQAEAQ